MFVTEPSNLITIMICSIRKVGVHNKRILEKAAYDASIGSKEPYKHHDVINMATRNAGRYGTVTADMSYFLILLSRTNSVLFYLKLH